MKWWLIFQVIAYWPATPQQVQIQGPFDSKELCDQVKDQFDTLPIRSKCISVQQAPTK